MLNLRHIEVFHAVYTSGSVSAAARNLNVSQPAVSKVLRHAEERLGFALFLRASGRLTPTDEAHTLFGDVDEIFDKIGSLRNTARNIVRRFTGHLRIAALPGFGLDVVPTAVAQFRALNPAITFDIQTLHSAEFLRAVTERDCDVAIGFDAPKHPRLSSQSVASGELVLLHRKGEFAGGDERVALSRVRERDFINVSVESGPLAKLFMQELVRQDLQIREAVTIGTMYTAAPLVRAGAGLAVVDSVTARALAGTDLAYSKLDPPLAFGIDLVHLADRPLPKLTKQFIQLLRKVMVGSADG